MSRKKEQKRLQQQEEYEAQRQLATDYYNYDMTHGADVSSLRKSRRYMAVGIVTLILVLILIGGAYLFRGQLTASDQTRCWGYEQQVEQFAQQYASQNGLASYPTYLDDVPGFADIKAQDPDGTDSYTWNPVTGEYTCPNHGHYPSGWNAPQSIMQGTQTTVENTSS